MIASQSVDDLKATARHAVRMPTKANRIKQVRELNGLSQEQFAAALSGGKFKITRGAVGNWELGGGLRAENLERIAEVFGADLNWLGKGRGSPPAPRFAQGEPISGATLTLDRDQDDDGHRVDPALARGEIAKFFQAHAGKNREAWQITTDLIDRTPCRPGVYVIVEIGKAPELRSIVLAELHRAGLPPLQLFRVWVGGKLITAATAPSDTPTLVVDDASVIVKGVVVAHKEPGS